MVELEKGEKEEGLKVIIEGEGGEEKMKGMEDEMKKIKVFGVKVK